MPPPQFVYELPGSAWSPEQVEEVRVWAMTRYRAAPADAPPWRGLGAEELCDTALAKVQKGSNGMPPHRGRCAVEHVALAFALTFAPATWPRVCRGYKTPPGFDPWLVQVLFFAARTDARTCERRDQDWDMGQLQGQDPGAIQKDPIDDDLRQKALGFLRTALERATAPIQPLAPFGQLLHYGNGYAPMDVSRFLNTPLKKVYDWLEDFRHRFGEAFQGTLAADPLALGEILRCAPFPPGWGGQPFVSRDAVVSHWQSTLLLASNGGDPA
ncbi:MAG: hypothetical protein IPK26_20445 [Planctomycetes bacterium]|nr:hypothetical protein [Planctomycetota bacterium]